jgi:hypothetical protein
LARILLVEDDADVRLMLEHVLLYEGYEVDSAQTVSGGKNRLRSGSYRRQAAGRPRSGGCRRGKREGYEGNYRDRLCLYTAAQGAGTLRDFTQTVAPV